MIRSEVSEILGEAQELIKGFGTTRKNLSSELRKDLSRSRAKSKTEVGKLLGNAQGLVKGFQTSRRDESNRLRDDLAQSKANMESDVKQMLNDFGQARGNVRADLKEARAAWQELASLRQAERGSQAPSSGEEIPDLETNMLAAVNEHPEGISLAEIAEGLGVAPIVLGRASKRLLDKGEIRKEEKLYFPAASE